MRAGGEYGEPVWRDYPSEHLAQLAQLRARLRHVDMRFSRDFELLLQKLALAPTEGRRRHRGEQRLRHVRRECFRLGVDEEILLLDAEAKRTVQISRPTSRRYPSCSLHDPFPPSHMR